MAELDSGTGAQARWSVAAVARVLGVAPSTVRSWDRRYGLGPSRHREGQHRRYSEADLARLEAMRRLLLQGVSTAEAARAVTNAHRDEGHAMQAPESGTSQTAGRPERPRPTNATVRQVREAALRMDADRVVDLLSRAVGEHDVTEVWETLMRPALTGIGARWTHDELCIAAEHLLSECATRVLHQAMGRAKQRAHRPVLLVCAPNEAHVLPLHALAAALAERSLPNRLLGAATPTTAITVAARRLQPSATVVWAHSPRTAVADVFAALPAPRGGRLVAAGPGWAQTNLPAGIARINSLPAALDLLVDDAL